MSNNKKDGECIEKDQNDCTSVNEQILDILNDDVLKKCFENRYGK